MKTEQDLDGNAVSPGGYTYFHAPPFAVIDRIGAVYVILLHQGLAQVLRGTHIPDPGRQFGGDSFSAVTFHEIRIPAFPEHAKGPLFAGLIDDPGPVIDQIDLIDQNIAAEKRRHNIVFRFTGADHFDYTGKSVLSGHPQPDRDRLDMDRSAVQHLIPGPAPARSPGFIADTVPAPAPAAPAYDYPLTVTGLSVKDGNHDTVTFYKVVEWVGETADKSDVSGWKAVSAYSSVLTQTVLKSMLVGDPDADPAVAPTGMTSEIAGQLAKLATGGVDATSYSGHFRNVDGIGNSCRC